MMSGRERATSRALDTSTFSGGKTRIPHKVVELMGLRDGDTLLYRVEANGICLIKRLTPQLVSR